MFHRVLIANRGEIALRIIRTCRELGMASVAVFSEVDAAEPHVTAADQAEPIGPATPRQSYLAVDRIIDAARRSGAEAVHPGYGFLSENPELAAACRDAGIAFVGPSADVIARAGSKIEARRLAAEAGVPVVPGGTPDDQTDAGLRRAVHRVGFPALLKAAAGGGGKGIRLVNDATELDAAIGAARREALAAFGDGTVYVERRLERPRHVEVQVAGDQRGGLVHLFERECSVQRRYQKVVEESPSPAVTPTIRERLTAAAVAVAATAGYDNVGTVEFLLDGEGDDARFYFLEMNTRLQVEHAVTELCTGVDLVRGQLLIAAGQPVPWAQPMLTSRGHAIECRVYAEDPSHDYLPQAGRIALYREPSSPGLRIDTAAWEGGTVPVQYDPLIAKVVTHAETRDLARRRALDALRRYAILGLPTNLLLLQRVLDHPRFVDGRIDTGFLADEHDALVAPVADIPLIAALAAAAALHQGAGVAVSPSTGPRERVPDPWTSLTDWRLTSPHTD